ncbi:gluconokinase [Cryobacterium sp. PH29-G1]|uniref:gluconokinase n=1 Tax=Cryobacterium sp. PH29-G1 TaxID=3046211 RepID=UPI0024BBB979|nr:gluconokinase [Cryobacterium sp. PH29-G1]MDJ0349767.1 gluconokinase [Cryobacterium sp. PH29-G1]
MTDEILNRTPRISSPEKPIVVMGVQGCGKSTVGRGLGNALGLRFTDGDDLHSLEARAKMAAGHPLTDADRIPWLTRIAETIAASLEHGEPIVVACSALKRSYRDLLRSIAPTLVFIELFGDQALIAERLTHRNHEYMPAALLDSQFAALEPLARDEAGLRINLMNTPDEIVELAVEFLQHTRFPDKKEIADA